MLTDQFPGSDIALGIQLKHIASRALANRSTQGYANADNSWAEHLESVIEAARFRLPHRIHSTGRPPDLLRRNATDLPRHVLQEYLDRVAAGHAVIPIDRVYTFDQIVEAHTTMEAGPASGQRLRPHAGATFPVTVGPIYLDTANTATALLAVHHWADVRAGIGQLRRVT